MRFPKVRYDQVPIREVVFWLLLSDRLQNQSDNTPSQATTDHL